MLSFSFTGLLTSGSFSFASDTLSFSSMSSNSGVTVFHHGLGTATEISTPVGGGASVTTQHSLTDNRISLGSDSSPLSLSRTMLDALIEQATATSAGSIRTFLSNGDHYGNAGVVLADQSSSATLIYVSEPNSTGLRVYQETTSGTLALVQTISGTVSPFANGISTMARLATDQGSFLYTGSALSNGIDIYQVSSSGQLQHYGSLGAADGLPVHTITAIEPATIDGEDFLVVAASGTSSLSVLQVASDGNLVLTDHALDTGLSRFQNVTEIDVISVRDHVFVIAGGSDGGVTLLTLLPDGTLIGLDTLIDTGDTSLHSVSALSSSVVGSDIHVFVGSGSEAGVTHLVIDIAALGDLVVGSSDHLIGTPQNDTLAIEGSGTVAAGAGDDILRDGNGQNTLTGGDGVDVFVFGADGQRDVISDFQVGVDRIDLIFALGSYPIGQISTTITSTGAILIYGNDILEIIASGAGLTEATLHAALVGVIDHPATSPVTQPPTPDPDPEPEPEPDPDPEPVPGSENDTLIGTAAGDNLEGGAGHDTLAGLAGDDLLRGGIGNDALYGGTGNDRLIGGSGEDILRGGAGNDTIEGGGQQDTIEGGGDNDSILGGNGRDSLFGEAGNDTLRGGVGNDLLQGGEGSDRLHGGRDSDTIYGGNGNDTLLGEFGRDRLFGGAGNDLLRGNGGDDTLDGGAGSDTLVGGNLYDMLRGGEGNDFLDGGVYADTLFGQQGNDTLIGSGGTDWLYGGNGHDSADGGNSHDRFWGGNGNDTFVGGAGNDIARGDAGNDHLRGGGDNDTLFGGGGFDTLIGGVGDDVLTGGQNGDAFVFASGHGQDTIMDFHAANANETIDLRGVAAITSIQDLLANHILSTANGNVVIDTGHNGQITLIGVQLDQLDSSDFLF